MISPFVLTLGLLLLPALAFAQQGGLVQVPSFAGTAQAPLPIALLGIVNAFLILVAIVAAIFIVIGGIRYITSGDEEEGQRKAKQTILYAIIGLIVVGLASVITNFVINAVAFGGSGGAFF